MNEQLKQKIIIPLQKWWNNLKQREQYLLGWGCAILIISLLYIYLWQPLNDKLNTLREDIVIYTELDTWLNQNFDEIRHVRQAISFASRLSTNTFLPVIERTLSDHYLSPSNINQINSSQVSLQFETTPFSILMVWLHELQSQYGVNIARAEFTNESEPGIVSATIVLEL